MLTANTVVLELVMDIELPPKRHRPMKTTHSKCEHTHTHRFPYFSTQINTPARIIVKILNFNLIWENKKLFSKREYRLERVQNHFCPHDNDR